MIVADGAVQENHPSITLAGHAARRSTHDGLWDRLSGRSAASTLTRPAVQPAATWAQRPTIAPGGEQHVAGESNYQRALEHVAGGRAPDGCAISLVTAELIREPHNRYDRNAVRVDIAGQVVGYLPRTDAPSYHQLITALWEQGLAATCWARLTGGWDRGRYDRGNIGIVLDINPRLEPCGQEVSLLLLAHRRVSVTGEEHCQDALRALLGRRPEVSAVGRLRLVESHPRRLGSGPMVEIEIGGAPMWLTAKMTERYGPVVQTAARAGVTPACEAVIAAGAGKIEAFVRLPTPELM
jgi:hypothetical protein